MEVIINAGLAIFCETVLGTEVLIAEVMTVACRLIRKIERIVRRIGATVRGEVQVGWIVAGAMVNEGRKVIGEEQGIGDLFNGFTLCWGGQRQGKESEKELHNGGMVSGVVICFHLKKGSRLYDIYMSHGMLRDDRKTDRESCYAQSIECLIRLTTKRRARNRGGLAHPRVGRVRC